MMTKQDEKIIAAERACSAASLALFRAMDATALANSAEQQYADAHYQLARLKGVSPLRKKYRTG